MKIKTIKKPWGKEEIVEENLFYLVKKLTMNKMSRCSLQYHNKKIETIFVLEGNLFIELGKIRNKLKIIKLKEGQYITLKNKIIHRMFAKNKKAVYLEASTSHMKDVVRLSDDYNRI